MYHIKIESIPENHSVQTSTSIERYSKYDADSIILQRVKTLLKEANYVQHYDSGSTVFFNNYAIKYTRVPI